METETTLTAEFAEKENRGAIPCTVRRFRVPTISEFFGILIRMYWDDHLPPHFHALYDEHEAQYNIATLDVINGVLPRRAHALVVGRMGFAPQGRADEEL